MKKRFLPFSLLLVIMVLGQSVMADQGGHYVPRAKGTTNAEAYLSSMRVNQHTGLIDPVWMIEASKQETSQPRDYADIVYWHSIGPDNLGGRTTSIIYNVNNRNEVYIGSMGGGVFYTWNQGVTWHQVGEDLMVSCMVQADNGTIYVGTGDGADAALYNGLANLGYENSFVGTGLYTIVNNEMTQIASTVPSIQNGVAEWSFINDIALSGNNIIVATGDGVKYSADNGETWSYVQVDGADLTGNAVAVKVGSDGTMVASVDGMIYIGTLDAMVCRSSSDDVVDSIGITSIATAAGLLDVAIAPSDANVIYAAAVGTSGDHVKVYVSEDKGETWAVALPTVDGSQGHLVYGGRGMFNHKLVVDPESPNHCYVLGNDLWRLDKPTSQSGGYYMATQLSSSIRFHGINDLSFDPRHTNKGYLATDAGIFKVEPAANGYLSYVNCNRGYVSTRCLTVAPSGKTTRMIGGVLGFGPVLIEGMEGTNNMGTSEILLPSIAPAYYVGYSESNEVGGSCAISLINPNAMFVTSNVDENPVQRTQTAGVDYDFSNFNSNQTFNYDAGTNLPSRFIPFALWESFNDENGVEGIWFKCHKNMAAGEVIQCYSPNGEYPFEYTLTEAMHYNSAHPELSDSVFVKDPVTAKMFVPCLKTNKYLFYTLDALKFNKAADWFKLAPIDDYVPTCIEVSHDGDVLFMGTSDGRLIRISNLSGAVDESTSTYGSDDFAPEVSMITLPVSQCVTSVSIFTDDSNKVVVTLGNYGNRNYVFYSDNALSNDPNFTSKQGNLPKMPVYASVFTSTYDGETTGHVLIGTDRGVYRTIDINAASPVWVAENDNMGQVPVLDLKQQKTYQPDKEVVTVVDSVEVVTVYPGVKNQGTIYAATYGRGLFVCETYHQNSEANVSEMPAAAQSKVTMYPNPVRDAANVSFEMNSDASVSYQVYDLSGRMVKVESLGRLTEGKHEINVSMEGLAKGAYVLRLNLGNETSTVKFMVF